MRQASRGAKRRSVQLAIQHDKWDKWQTCFVIDGLELPSTPFLGFSALTGDVSGESQRAACLGYQG